MVCGFVRATIVGGEGWNLEIAYTTIFVLLRN